MLFCSQQFILFFLSVFVVYWSMPSQRVRIYLLLIASFVFYAAWNHWLAILIVVSSTLDYLIARRLDASARERERKVLVGFSVCFNLGILCYFKYANFFLRSLEDSLRLAGASASFPVLSVILPIGISFYTFEAISYSVDVYRRKIKAERNLGHFMLFILFFPHLVAGPIVRGSDFLPQIRRKKRWNWMRINLGLQLFLLGMFKKLAIADRLAVMVDAVYADPGSFGAPMLWLAAVGFAVQVYCDFSGYSDMALGTAHLLGYKLRPNFNLPFLARNIAEFWRRWHLTLSSWLRDYVYIPLGGSRGSIWQASRNLLITMALCGLWHGASWNYVIFGVIQGLCLIGYRFFRKWSDDRPWLRAILQTRLGTACCIALTFLVFSVTLVVFRADSMLKAWSMWQGMFALKSSGIIPSLNYVVLGCMFAIVAMGYWLAGNDRWRRGVASVPPSFVGMGYSVMATLALVLAPDEAKTFIYFQF